MALEFTLLLNGDNSYHKDFIITAKETGLIIIADTYHFETNRLREYLSNYLNEWLEKILQLQQGEYVLMPIDLSDQYVGLLKVELSNNSYTIIYGYTEDIQGWGILGDDTFTVYSSTILPDWRIAFQSPFQLSREEIKESFDLKVTEVAIN